MTDHLQEIRNRASIYQGRCSTQDVLDLCDEIERLRARLAELVSEGAGLRLQNREVSDEAKAAWATSRAVALEEAATLAEFRYEHWKHANGAGVSCDVTACEEIAAAIRALK